MRFVGLVLASLLLAALAAAPVSAQSAAQWLPAALSVRMDTAPVLVPGGEEAVVETVATYGAGGPGLPTTITLRARLDSIPEGFEAWVVPEEQTIETGVGWHEVDAVFNVHVRALAHAPGFHAKTLSVVVDADTAAFYKSTRASADTVLVADYRGDVVARVLDEIRYDSEGRATVRIALENLGNAATRVTFPAVASPAGLGVAVPTPAVLQAPPAEGARRIVEAYLEAKEGFEGGTVVLAGAAHYALDAEIRANSFELVLEAPPLDEPVEVAQAFDPRTVPAGGAGLLVAALAALGLVRVRPRERARNASSRLSRGA